MIAGASIITKKGTAPGLVPEVPESGDAIIIPADFEPPEENQREDGGDGFEIQDSGGFVSPHPRRGQAGDDDDDTPDQVQGVETGTGLWWSWLLPVRIEMEWIDWHRPRIS